MTLIKPTIICLHGAYHPPACYDGIRTRLEAAGFEVVLPRNASLGKDTNGSFEDDTAVVRKAVKTLVNQGKEVVIAAHSYGGFVGMNAAKGLTAPELEAEGRKGGIKAIVYMSATLAKSGGTAIEACNPSVVRPPDIGEIYDIQQSINGKPISSLKDNDTTRRYYYYPAPKEEVDKVMALLEPQAADVFYIPSPFSPADLNIPQTYIISKHDQTVLAEFQEQFVADMGLSAVRMDDCGHAPFLNHPQKIVDIIITAASS